MGFGAVGIPRVCYLLVVLGWRVMLGADDAPFIDWLIDRLVG